MAFRLRQEEARAYGEGMKKLVPLLPALLLPAACNRAPEAPQVTVEHAVVTVPAVPGGPGAAYFTLKTNADPTRLVSVASPSVQRIELHGTMSQGNMTGMASLQPGDLGFSPSTPLEFASGGKHAMLMGVDPALRPGAKVRLTLTFEGAPPASVEADVVGPGQAHGAH